ncbi:hypothetical protein EJ08DRAFT_683651 [Tothia fuscella]|uniref:Uncharacterized protein n=1 Tax=Tothia fuscella TaxID=1048955 RepID=A0A9P4NFV7_9PEZI|nr:hypothetical protein EJ08DRAFT_683651 [Tothia fuscella]
MASIRNTMLRIGSRPVGRAYARRPHSCQQRYASSDTPPTSGSSTIPWIIGALALTGGGTFYALQPSGGSISHDSGSHENEGATDKLKRKIGEKKEESKEKVADLESAVKPQRSGTSEKNHATASHNNEHKIRHGKFCDEDFDNHVTEHSSDPGSDFEKVDSEKKEAKEKAKSKA